MTLTDQDIQRASLMLHVYAKDVIEMMEAIRDLNTESWKLTTADLAKVEQSIKQLGKAQYAMRQARERITIAIA